MKLILKISVIFACLITTQAFGQTYSIQGRDRSSWYIGFGVGGGQGVLDLEGFNEDFSEGGVGFMFKVGGVINNRLLVGFETSAWRYQEDAYAMQFNHYNGMVTFFPFDNAGFFIKGGLGFGVLVIEFDRYHLESSEAGFDIKGGIGYELRLGEAFHLGGEFDFAATTHEDFTTQDGMFLITFSWY